MDKRYPECVVSNISQDFLDLQTWLKTCTTVSIYSRLTILVTIKYTDLEHNGYGDLKHGKKSEP